ncbi:MAG TPA: tetratricopeptide repeat protein [Verrucomicrobiota bacterium]|nr:tetratricopeptide repeat protein [Verrucomicrobiota bacterium]
MASKSKNKALRNISKKIDNKEKTEDNLISRPAGLKKIAFYFLLILSPFVFLFAIEGVLRVVNYGYPTSFLLKYKHNGKEYYTENRKFGYRFFPKSMARAPEKIFCEAKKPENTYRIVVFGESAALGDPSPEYSFSRMIGVILKNSRSDLNFEIINVSMTAINSFVIREIARDCKKLDADLWIIYAGNNEVIGPFSPGTVFGPGTLPEPLIRILINMKCLKVSQLIDSIVESISSEKVKYREWEGMEMFLKNQIPFNSPLLENVYKHFENNLSAVVKEGRDIGSDVLLTTVVANYRDCAPFSSIHKNGVLNSELEKWNQYFDNGKKLESDNKFKDSVEYYLKSGSIDDLYAELNFRLARCLEKSGAENKVLIDEYYKRAVDCDALRFRPDSRIIDTIKTVAKEYNDKIVFIDTTEKLYECSGFKLPGREFLWEHVHLNFDGNYQVATLFAEQILKLVDKKFLDKKSKSNPTISKEQVYLKLGLTEWDMLEVGREMQKRLELAPFTNRCNHTDEMMELGNKLNMWNNIVRTNPMDRFIAVHNAAVKENPNDWILYEKYAEILEAAGRYESAVQQWSAITNLFPVFEMPYFKIGNLLDQMGKSSEALKYFESALKINPESAESLSGIGLCLLNLKKYNEAITVLKKAIKIKPNFAAAYVNLSLAYANLGMMNEAKNQCELALNVKPDYAPAYINLGKYYASEGNSELSLSNYINAAKAEKFNPIVYYNLANAYARLGMHKEAITNYNKAIELKPAFGEAILNLAIELSLSGFEQEAFKKFEEAVNLMPENSDALFNYGIACAKKGDYNRALINMEKAATLRPDNPQIHYNIGLVYLRLEMKRKAIEEFRKVLQIDPSHKEAQLQLNRINSVF